jgi:hypothetical protein
MELSLHIIPCFFLEMLNLGLSMPSISRSGMPTLRAKHLLLSK